MDRKLVAIGSAIVDLRLTFDGPTLDPQDVASDVQTLLKGY